MEVLYVFQEAIQTAYYTLVYLWAYAFSVGWVFVLSAAFGLLFREEKLRGCLASPRPLQRIAGAMVLGLLGSPHRRVIENNIRWLIRNTKTSWLLPIFLAGRCNLTIYYWLLLGPLLGKEFIMVNVIGAALFLCGTCPGLLLLGQTKAESSLETCCELFLKSRPPLFRGFLKALAREVIGVGPWMLWGSFVGGDDRGLGLEFLVVRPRCDWGTEDVAFAVFE